MIPIMIFKKYYWVFVWKCLTEVVMRAISYTFYAVWYPSLGLQISVTELLRVKTVDWKMSNEIGWMLFILWDIFKIVLMLENRFCKNRSLGFLGHLYCMWSLKLKVFMKFEKWALKWTSLAFTGFLNQYLTSLTLRLD